MRRTSRSSEELRLRPIRRHRDSLAARRALFFESLERRELLAAITESGGIGGTTRFLPLPADLSLITYFWENYSIKDEFRLEYQGQRIVGDVGLQSGGHSGKTVFASPNSTAAQLTVKVTAPTQGTAWDFTVEANPVELHVDARLGDVTKVSIGQLFKDATGQTLDAVGIDPKSIELVSMSDAKWKVAEIDNWEKELERGIFYFVPNVDGAPLDYNTQHTTDSGLGDSEVRIRAMVDSTFRPELGTFQIEFPIKFSVTDGFSTSFSDSELMQTIPAVSGAGTTKLDIYRQEQRLAYLGYQGPTAGGDKLSVDGVAQADTTHAKRMYSVAVRTEFPSSNNGVMNASSEPFKEHINSSDPPFWNRLSNIAGVTFDAAGRRYGTDHTGYVLESAQTSLGDYETNGVSRINGDGVFDTGGTSYTHDAGRGFDIDIGGVLFQVVGYPGVPGGFVKAPGGPNSIAVRDGNGGYRPGDVTNAVDRANGVRAGVGIISPSANTLKGSTTPDLIQALHQANCLVFTDTDENAIRAKLTAFVAPTGGANRIFYNDPRFLDTQIDGVTVQFSRGHFDHMHFNLPSALNQRPLSQAANISAFSLFEPFASLSLPAASAVDLGPLTALQSISGALDMDASERLYRFQVGDFSGGDFESEFFDTPRDVSIHLDGLAEDADLKLVYDLNGDGEFGTDEMLFESATVGLANESISALQLPSGVYYALVVARGGQTPFNLALNVAPLPVPLDGAGKTVATAADLGILGAASRTDFIGEVDSEDLYSFQITSVSDIAVAVTGLDQGDVSAAIGQDANGNGVLDLDEVMAFSDEEGNGDESLTLSRLAIGSYLVRVLLGSGNSSYQLEVSATASVIPDDQAGDTPAAATDLGALSAAVNRTDFVGGIDPTDFYKFTLAAATGLRIDLTGLSADADVDIYRDADGNGVLSADELLASSTLGGSTSEQIDLAGLSPGSYFVRVGQYEGDTTYALALTPQAAIGADLAVTRTGSVASSDLGDQFTYSVKLTNNGPEAASNVVLTELLPSGLKLIRVNKSVGNGSIQFTGDGFRGNFASLAAGASVTFDITVFAFQAGRLPMNTTVSAATADYDLSNNTFDGLQQVSAITAPPADLSLVQSVDNLNPSVGDQVTITLTVINNGPGTATDIRVRDMLPSSLTYVSSTADLGVYDPTTGVWNVGNMLPNASLKLRIIVKASDFGSQVNTAEVIGVAEADPDSTPNNQIPTEDDQASVLIAVVGSDTQPPTATLADPIIDGTICDQALNSGQYLDVTFADSGESGLDPATILDEGQELVLSGVGAEGVTLDGAPRLVPGTTATYRYSFTGSFQPGSVIVRLLADSVADVAGNGILAEEIGSFSTLPCVWIKDVTVVEGSRGSVNAVFQVTLSAPSSRFVTVSYATTDGTATASADYSRTRGTLVFRPGETTKLIVAHVRPDRLYEDDETFRMLLTGATRMAIGRDSATATITNDDRPPTVSIVDASIQEGDAGSQSIGFLLSLSEASGKELTVSFATADSSATAADGDYQPISGTVTFSPGVTAKTLGVVITGDSRYEATETFQVDLSGAIGGTLGRSVAMGTLVNDDAMPSISISSLMIREPAQGAVTAQFVVSLSAASGLPVSVGYATSNGTAIAGSDYTATVGTLRFEPGETMKLISVDILADLLVEADERFSVALRDLMGARLTRRVATGRIQDAALTALLGASLAPVDSASISSALGDDATLGLVE
jgi:uncharacterized repeat protein (TIGR01451 family)